MSPEPAIQESACNVLPFLHSPLQPRQIRLLHLLPDIEERKSNLISCSCSIVSLDEEDLSFIALSYCWGNTEPTHAILINGSPFFIRKNLHAFLQQSQISQDARPIWIDAICIDQTNTVERGSQVNHMGDLYSKASLVKGWLGSAEENSHIAFELIDYMNLKFASSEPLDEDELLLNPFTTPNSPAWTALGRLMCLPWFSRVWIIQEIVLAKSVLILWGTYSISWEALAQFVVGVLTHQLQVYQQDPPEIAQTPERRRWGWNTVLSSHKTKLRLQEGIAIPMSVVMTSWRNLATDPKDHIYSKLGFILQNQKDKLVIEPDYSVDTAQMYAGVSGKIILQEKSLDLLTSAGVGYARSLPGLPSWTPDFQYAGYDNRDFRSFNAAGDTKAKVSYGGNNELAVCGYMIDIISEVSNVWEEHFDALEAWTWYQEVEEQFHKPGINKEEFWRTLIANKPRMLDGSRGADGMETYFEAFKTTINLRFSSSSDIPGESNEERKEREEKCTAFLPAMHTALKNRRFCETNKGRLASVPPGGEKGDCVFLALGGECPLLVRMVANDGDNKKVTWRFVGTCYIHGVMDGEGLKMGLEEEEIVLI